MTTTTSSPTAATPRTWSLSGTVRAVSPISHGDGHLGTTTLIRTVKVVQPDGSVANVPAVSGNAVRGRLRRISADMAWRHAGRPGLTPAQVRVLYQGGSLTKSQKRMPSEQVAVIRRVCPHLALFGWSGGGRIVEGRSKVREMIPLCEETAHILPTTEPGSFWDRLDVMEFSRMEDTVRSIRQDRIGDAAEVVDDDSDQMRYAVQVIAAGTRLAWGVGVEDPSPAEVAWLRMLLSLWAGEGATVGGRSAAGFGRLALDDMGEWMASALDMDVLARHAAEHEAGAAEALSWLDA